MARSQNKIPTSVVGRTGRLLLSGAKIATKEIAGRISAKLGELDDAASLASRVRQTQELVDTLSHLKGAAMKAGQLLSLELSDVLPPEILAVLRQLHDDSTFMPFAKVRQLLQVELGQERLAQLAALSEEPIAAASIGQVHKATYLGRPVVVKIQYPGVADTIGSDLAVLRRTAALYLQVQGRSIDLVPFFAEVQKTLERETDYLQEADSVERYRAALGGDAYVVPEVFREVSTRRVLTLSHESGVKLSDWLRAGPGPKALARFKDLVLSLLIAEFFAHGLVQTDPNYGNFLYRPVEGRLVLLDFGAVSQYEPAFREQIRTLVLAVLDGDEGRLMELSHRYGFLDPREPEAARQAYLEMVRLICLPFERAQQPFHFADEQYIKSMRDAAFRVVQNVKYSPPAKQLVFLNRKLGGMFHVLKDAGVSDDLHARMAHVRDLKIS